MARRPGRLSATIIATIILLFTFGAAGCGDDSPSAAVEEFIEASVDNDCDKVVDMIYFGEGVDSAMKDSLVESCKETGLNPEGSELVSVETSDEKIDGDTATVTTNVTTKIGGEEMSEEQDIVL
jgi:hypothetical protein